jgi:anti-sigma factor RsiW
MDNRKDPHLTDEQLLMHADGELTGRDGDTVREHLDACWSCRARLGDLQATINTVARFRNEVLLPAAPPSLEPWPGLKPRLEALEGELRGRSVYRRVRHVFGARSKDPLRSHHPTRVVYRRWGAIAAMVILGVWLGTDSASAAAARRGLFRIAGLVAAILRGSPAGTPPVSTVASRHPAPEPLLTPAPKIVVPKTSTNPPPRRLTSQELVELELEAVTRLDRVGAFLGEQVTVERRTGRSELRVQAIVDSKARKREILSVLGPLTRHRAVVVEVATVAEAVAAQAAAPISPTAVRSVEIDTKPAPVHEDLRRYVIGRLRRENTGGGQVDLDESTIQREIQSFTVKLLDRSLQARLHARALTQAVQRFSPDEVRGLSTDAHRSWYRMLQQHAEGLQRETAGLRNDLHAVFASPVPTDDGSAGPFALTEADLPGAAARLFELASLHDATVARTFSLSSEEPKPEPPVWGPFYRSLVTAERLASRIMKLVAAE